MPYIESYTARLAEINSLITEGKILGSGEALEKFKDYIDAIANIGSYSKVNWPRNWANTVYQFGEKLKQFEPNGFVEIIDRKITSTNTVDKEVLEFIKTEIVCHKLVNLEDTKLSHLISEYPLNPEFRHTIGHFYLRDNFDLEKAVENYRFAHEIDRSVEVFISNLFSAEQQLFNELIYNGNLDDAKKIVERAFEDKSYIDNRTVIRTTYVDMSVRVRDHQTFRNSMRTVESNFIDKLNTELSNERRRVIEIIGFFSAIVAFILTTVSIAKNFSFVEAIYFLMALGMVLILFTVGLSILFNPQRKTFLYDVRLWVLIVSVSLMLYLITMAETVGLAFKLISGQ